MCEGFISESKLTILLEKNMIDWQKIDKTYIPAQKKNKPKFLNVTDDQWSEALDGVRETASEMDFVKTDNTEDVWNIIYFSAMYFCKGFEHAEIKHGHKKQSFYPVY